MKTVVIESICLMIFIVLFAYTTGEFYKNVIAITQFDEAFAKGILIDVEVNIAFIPAIITILFGVGYLVYSWRKKPWTKASFFKMGEFQEADERELYVTSKATKTSYVAVMASGIVGMGVMVFSTSIIQSVPALPIYIMAGILLVASLVYTITWGIEIRK